MCIIAMHTGACRCVFLRCPSQATTPMFVIDGNANAAGEAVVTQGAGAGTLATNVLVCYLVEIEGGNSGPEFCFDALHRIGGDAATGADAVDLDR